MLADALHIFNSNREVPLQVTRQSRRGNNYTFSLDERTIGSIAMVNDFSNCGVLNLHNLNSGIKQDRDLILEFVKVFARMRSRGILTYNTSSYQRGIKNSLKQAKFHTMSKTFLNANSESRIQFHVAKI